LSKNAYILSGLGADERVFQGIDFFAHKITFIKWIPPLKKETIENYATRISAQIKSTKPTLIGLSFGGIVAIEIAKQIEIEKIILIASVKSKNEIPFYYRIAGQINLHKIFPARLLKSSNFISNWFFSTKSAFDKQLLKRILHETDPKFLKWAIDKIVKWKNTSSIKNIYHIHGTYDKILPIQFVSCNLKIKKGGHLMTLNKVKELNKVLKEQLK
jgi:pimeloyl-ACP methyl ester carboxylesterase